MKPLIVISGPTASGKSALALTLAECFDGEIISVDSAQVYRGMDIGTAKPDATTRARVAHHLIDLIAPTAVYSAARFARDACAAIATTRARGKRPVLVGGTMLYFKALFDGLSDLPQADAAVRKEIDIRAQRAGWATLHRELAQIDPVTAARLTPADRQRIQRALEVWRITGVPMSRLQGKQRAAYAWRDCFHIALLPENRAFLHERITQRLDAMLSNGFVEEVRRLREQYSLSPDLPSMRSVGYRQIWHYLDGAYDFKTMRAKAIIATRQLAKRQITWLRATPNNVAIDPFADDFAKQITSLETALR
ncbi:MAG: tRNA (adenosine(37)-N6)-dimethylallyltransferase MiaA [Burkholderiales bacterium]|nr:tRNA (adenosine(37)-N6)-dimethylallyltransferase MiaA [Burkholderiales bacterium]